MTEKKTTSKGKKKCAEISKMFRIDRTQKDSQTMPYQNKPPFDNKS